MLLTVLFTDIVGSTERAVAIGDKRWKQLLNAHHALVRRELKRHDGREIDTAGDGFFATFNQPGQAIACAEAISRDVRRLGIEIRAGIHMGEVEVNGPKVGGIAVHIAARVMSKANAGQVLVSSTVRDLMAGSDLRFDDVGVHELKGVPAQWRLYAVEAPSTAPADEDSAEAIERPPGRLPLGRLLGAAGVVAVLAIVATVLILGHGGGKGFVVGPNTVVRIDPRASTVAGGAVVGTTPSAIAYGDGMVWVANFDDRTLQSIDPGTGVAGPAFGGLTGNPAALAVGGGFVWVTVFQGGALRVDPRQHNAASPIDVGTGAEGVAFGLGAGWITNSQDDTLLQVDAGAGPPRVTQTIRLEAGSSPIGVAIGAGSVWVAESLAGKVVRIDPATGVVTQTITLLHGDPEQLAFGAGYVWASVPADDSVLRIDPRTDSAVTIPNVGNGPKGIAAGPDGVWVANSLDGSVAEIDGATVVRRLRLGDGLSVEGAAESPGAVWVSVRSPS
jgi:streptogramin lyase